jgi:hypothetical protein
MERIRWDKGRKCFVLSDGTSSQSNAFDVETALKVSLTSLRRALAQQAGVLIPPVASLPPPASYENVLEFYKASKANIDLNDPSSNAEIVFDAPEPLRYMLWFALTPQGHLRANFQIERVVVTDRKTVIEITQRLFNRQSDSIELAHYQVDDQDGPTWHFHMVCDPTGRTVGALWHMFQTLRFFLTAWPQDLIKSSEGVQLALRLGRPDALIGTHECSWLDAKSNDYLLSAAPEKIKLAQDVARFANADGGLLVLGLRTSRASGTDVISQVTPLPMPARAVGRYRTIIDRHVYPFIRGLEIFSVLYEKGELIVISIPPQSDADKPFVVHGNLGSITDNRVKGEFISVVQRRGEGAEYLSGPVVHGLLARGRPSR